MLRYFLVCLLCLVFLTACNKPGTSENFSPKETGQYGKTLLIGLIPEQNIFKQIERYEPLARYLSGKTGADIQIKILPRYGNIISNFMSSNLDGAFFGSFTFSLASARLGLVLLARPEGLDGISTYHGLIFVRKDSHIKNARDMKGKRFAFVDKATTAGYLLPLEYFKENHIYNYKDYFKETYFTGTHDDAIYDVLAGKADIGAAKNTVYDRMADSDRRVTDELSILARSPEVPENALAVRKDLDPDLRDKLKTALLTMQDDPRGREVLKDFGAARFIETKESDYEPVFRYAKHIGLDLATYDYLND